jgi:CHASE2 domain-containing sensor protein
MKSRTIDWLIRILMLDKALHFLGEVWSIVLKPTFWLRTLLGAKPFIEFFTWWHRQSSLIRHIVGNMIVGLGIALLLWSMHGFSWLHEIEDSGIDWLMKIQWSTQPAKPALPFALIDIDEETYRSWGEPFHIPRDRLVKLVKHAVDGGASAIVIDVDLSQRGYDSNADALLMDYLAGHNKPGNPPIILTRVFREPLKSEISQHRSIRRSFLEDDERIGQSQLVFWGSPLFNLEQDRMLRRWRLWESVCNDEHHGIVPSIQLLTVALLNNDKVNPDQTASNLEKSLTTLVPEKCGRSKPEEKVLDDQHSNKIIDFSGMNLYSDPDALAQRIVYTQPWQLRPGQDRIRISVKDGSETDIPSLSIRSALPIFNPSVNTSWLKGRVVVIGASFSESRDRYLTPLGEMPGALVLINAIHSLQQYGELTGPPWYVKLFVEAVLIAIMSLAFAWFDSFWGMVVSGAVIILSLLPLSFMVFRYGIWLDFAIPLVAVQLHQMAEEFKEHYHKHTQTHGQVTVTDHRASRKGRNHKSNKNNGKSL